jgi:hypothetical protein
MDQVWLTSTLLACRTLDDKGAAAALAGLTPDAGELYDQLWRAKVIREARGRLERLPGGVLAEVERRVRAAVAEDDDWRAQATGYMVGALRIAADVGAGVMKGLALATYYDDPLSRHMGDVDLHCADWAGVIEFCRRATDAGWVWDVTEFPWIKWDGRTLYGQLSLVIPDNENPVARVDLHVGPYSVGPNGRVHNLAWTYGEALGVPGRHLDATTLALILVAHAANDGFLSGKDLNDFAALEDSGQLDTKFLERECARFACEDVLVQIRGTVRALRELIGPGGIPDLLARATDGPLSLRPRTGRTRALHAGLLAMRIARREGRSSLASVRTAWTSYRYYAADLTVRSGTPRARLQPRLRRPDTCWRLIPAEAWPRQRSADGNGHVDREPLATGMTSHTRRKGVAVTVDSHVFIPTIWGQISDDSIALATRLMVP